MSEALVWVGGIVVEVTPELMSSSEGNGKPGFRFLE